MTTILDALLVVEEGQAPRPLMSMNWPVWAVVKGYVPEIVGYVGAEIDKKTGGVAFGILPQGAQRRKLVDMQTAVTHLRAMLPARQMAKLPQAVQDALSATDN